MTEFKPGTPVMLKSGGPTMSVDWVGDHYGSLRVCCSWFVGPQKHQDTFVPETLMEVPQPAAKGSRVGYASFSR